MNKDAVKRLIKALQDPEPQEPVKAPSDPEALRKYVKAQVSLVLDDVNQGN